MNLKVRLTGAFLLSLGCLIGFGLVALLINERKIERFDAVLIHAIQGLEAPALTIVLKLFTMIGAGRMVAVLSLVVLCFLYFVLHHRRELILFLWVVAGSALLNESLKMIFQRARPTLHRIIEVNGFSFPSGHSMAAFSLYSMIAFLLWQHIPAPAGRIVLIMVSSLMILTIGFSRIYLGVHYPSDVIGGYLASGCWVASAIWFYRMAGKRKIS